MVNLDVSEEHAVLNSMNRETAHTFETFMAMDYTNPRRP
jgi:hypothetical protein